MLRVRFDPTGPIVISTPYHVETSSGLRLASFATQRMAEAYTRSALVKLALDLQQEFGQQGYQVGRGDATVNLNYSSFSNEHFKTPRLIIESAYPSDAVKSGLIGSGTDFWKYAVIFAPEDISPIGWRMSELSKEQMNRLRDHIHALYDLHRTQFTDAVFAYAKAFRDAEDVNATGSIDPHLKA